MSINISGFLGWCLKSPQTHLRCTFPEFEHPSSRLTTTDYAAEKLDLMESSRN